MITLISSSVGGALLIIGLVVLIYYCKCRDKHVDKLMKEFDPVKAR